jgi:hypothetical protein
MEEPMGRTPRPQGKRPKAHAVATLAHEKLRMKPFVFVIAYRSLFCQCIGDISARLATRFVMVYWPIGDAWGGGVVVGIAS